MHRNDNKMITGDDNEIHLQYHLTHGWVITIIQNYNMATHNVVGDNNNTH